MQQGPIITLTTDFGYRDPFVGIMKGVILSINPLANVVDITHGINSYNIRDAALTIGMSYRQFPPRTIHIVVTDPGVGSVRRPVMVVTEDHYFIGPDNGVFSIVYDESERHEVIHLNAVHYFGHNKSATFHGKDIFSPVAAWLSKGIISRNMGDVITDHVRLQFPVPSMPAKTMLEGEILYIDHFGNAMTNIKASNIEMLRNAKPDSDLRVVLKGKEVPFKQHYSQADDDGLYALINSMDYLELYVYRGDSSKKFDLKVGDSVGAVI